MAGTVWVAQICERIGAKILWRGRLRPVAAVWLLLFLAPLVAEYLCGSLSMAQVVLLPLMMLLYGTGAVLIRELARHSGRGYATILLLAVGYGLIEEGILDQTLFNPGYLGLHLLDFGYIPALDLALPFTVYVLGIHAIWSIMVPIALVEALCPHPQGTWLSRKGVIVMASLYALGAVTVFLVCSKWLHFMARPSEMGVCAAGAVLCGVVAFFLPRLTPPRHRFAISPWLVGGCSFVLSSAFVLVYGQGRDVLKLSWPVVSGAQVGLLLVMLFAGFCAARSRHWSGLHRATTVGGALLTYCWLGFFTGPVLHPGSLVFPHALLVAVMLALLVWVIRKQRAPYQ